ncbi:hypothetical protein [Enterobacter hormaechei]|uniref:hypothetical protein n=1 Tax=Enterobacter hormaechei TaxID=158836 RepID=UPI002875D8DE|nr:hypothetical protein [Enterobacter hormaechei]MDS0935066.1 hypothetical protein [Enterobacter hormaechei]
MDKFSMEVYEYFVMDGSARYDTSRAAVLECLGRRLPQAWKIRRDWGGTDAVIARALVKAEDVNGNTTSSGDFEYVIDIE